MTAFEFYLSFYGLLLGLSVAQVASGIGHAVVIRKDIHIGSLTILLCAFMLVDISSFWIWAWNSREVITVSYASVFIGLVIALAYFVAAVLLFPVRDEDWTDLDRHYWANKRLVMIGIGIANVIVITEVMVRRRVFPASDLLTTALLAFYWVPFAILIVSRRGWLDRLCLASMIGTYIAAAFFL